MKDGKKEQVHSKANGGVSTQTKDVKNEAAFRSWNRRDDTFNPFLLGQALMKAWKRMRKIKLPSRIFG